MIRIWAQLHRPLQLKKVGDYWQICIAGTEHNVYHNDENVFVVFPDEELARETYATVRKVRKTQKFKNKIVVGGE